MRLQALSLGAGVQSTTLALMAASGEIPRPDVAIFADTGWEPASVYEHLAKLEAALPFPVERVSAGDIRESIATGRYEPIPWYVPGGIGRRQCTKQYKLYPIRDAIKRRLRGWSKWHLCDLWLGISLDEAAFRMKDSSIGYIRNVYPLVDARMTRGDCQAWLQRAGWDSVPRSACCGCPFLSDADWQKRRQQPEWKETVELSHRLAATGQYMHRSLKPLDQIDFRSWSEKGQGDLFGAECEGMCGI